MRIELPLQVTSTGEMQMFELRRNGDALHHLAGEDVVSLTELATRATFYIEGVSAEQRVDNEQVPAISGTAVSSAAEAEHQHLVAAFSADRTAGFMIATRHAPDDLELNWLMVHPDVHGSGLAVRLMQEGLYWLGEDRPIWLTVISTISAQSVSTGGSASRLTRTPCFSARFRPGL